MRTTSTDGLLLVDKPAGMTSHDVVAVARRALQTRRVGHTGTLDPFATGLLVLLVGRATRLAQYVPGDPKVYAATIDFGAETTTDDVTGEVTRRAAPPTATAVDDAISALTGSILQRPPDYSAKQVSGRRAYAAARAGAPLMLEPVSVVVHGWHVRRRADTSIDVTITCGGGTYIRALARDLGRAAGSAAHLTALRRTRSGAFEIADAVSLDRLQQGALELAPLRAGVPQLPARVLTADEQRRVNHGNFLDASSDHPFIALIAADGALVAIARTDGGALRPCLVMHDD